MVFATILWLLYRCLSGLITVSTNLDDAPLDPAKRAGYFVEMFGAIIAWFILYVVLFDGSIQTLRCRSYPWAMVPCSLCWPIGVGFGIWEIIVLPDKNAKALFRSRG